MKEYKITHREYLVGWYYVEAENEDDAMQKYNQMLREGKPNKTRKDLRIMKYALMIDYEKIILVQLKIAYSGDYGKKRGIYL